MSFFNQLIGAFIEAWGEVRVQKTRVIISLLGVVAAVAAMTIVIALSQFTQQQFAESMEAFSGRDATIHVRVSQQTTNSDSPANIEQGFEAAFLGGAADSDLASAGSPAEANSSGRGEDSAGKPLDPVGDAMTTAAKRFQIPYWSHRESHILELREVLEARQTGQFRGKPAEFSEFSSSDTVSLLAVDPAYEIIFRLQLLQGRWLHPDDWQQRVAPAVINETLWAQLGRPELTDPLILHTNDDSARQLRVVGVVKSKTLFEENQLYVSYQGWKYMNVGITTEFTPDITMLVWVSKEQAQLAQKVLPDAVAAVLGEGWQATAENTSTSGNFAVENAIFTVIIMVIGGIVIFLGSLGLLNVAIVTVRQRIREIGIRRAMGASAARVFFAVFMESVVATFIAGVLGVALAVVTLQMIPLHTLGFTLQEQPPFPFSAAVIGVVVATCVGALCGIIPAAAAIRVKPIDAIRY